MSSDDEEGGSGLGSLSGFSLRRSQAGQTLATTNTSRVMTALDVMVSPPRPRSSRVTTRKMRMMMIGWVASPPSVQIDALLGVFFPDCFRWFPPYPTYYIEGARSTLCRQKLHRKVMWTSRERKPSCLCFVFGSSSPSRHAFSSPPWPPFDMNASTGLPNNRRLDEICKRSGTNTKLMSCPLVDGVTPPNHDPTATQHILGVKPFHEWAGAAPSARRKHHEHL